MAPFQIVGNPGGPQQITLTQGGALLTQLAGGQPNVIFELGGATSKETQGKADNEGLKTQSSQGQVGTSVVGRVCWSTVSVPSVIQNPQRSSTKLDILVWQNESCSPSFD